MRVSKVRKSNTATTATNIMTRHDYNGSGNWAVDAVQQRYVNYARVFKVPHLADLTPQVSTQGDRMWIYPIMHQVIKAIEKKDLASIQIGIEFIEQDQHFPFGKILKSNTARALRRAPLSGDQEECIRVRVVTMLVNGQVPHEYKEYARLLRRIGIGDLWPLVESAKGSNRYVSRYYRYFLNHARPADAII